MNAKTLPSSAEQFNQSCRCVSIKQQLLKQQIAGDDADLYRMLTEDRPHLFAASAVFLSQASFAQQVQIIAALERVIAMPAYQKQVLANASASAQFQPGCYGAFLGYDFHLHSSGPKLIEINSNAGGALLNAKLMRAQLPCCEMVGYQHPGKLTSQLPEKEPEQNFIDMFLQEWRLQRGEQTITRIAIVDEQPDSQYLFPEFLLFQQLFTTHGIQSVICDATDLSYKDGCLCYGDLKIDLVYNRLTDFSLDEPKHSILRAAYLEDAIVLTPNPRTHALYANKTNLVWLCNHEFLNDIGVDAQTCQILTSGIAHTILVQPEQAESLWSKRKQLFFKPAKGFGGKAAYRGDKLTRGVFQEIIQQEYVAQTTIQPSHRLLEIDGQCIDLKLDFRHYVYNGQTQLVCARLYQGQTTNFRTPGGGFAQVVLVD